MLYHILIYSETELWSVVVKRGWRLGALTDTGAPLVVEAMCTVTQICALLVLAAGRRRAGIGQSATLINIWQNSTYRHVRCAPECLWLCSYQIYSNDTGVLMIQVCQWHRCANDTGVSMTPVCQWYRCANDTGVPMIQVWQWYRCVNDTGVLKMQVC